MGADAHDGGCEGGEVGRDADAFLAADVGGGVLDRHSIYAANRDPPAFTMQLEDIVGPR